MKFIGEELREHPIATPFAMFGGTLILKSLDDSIHKFFNDRARRYENTIEPVGHLATEETVVSGEPEEIEELYYA